MLLVVVIILVAFTVLTVVFSFPEFSPIPYFPSNRKDLKLILKALNLRNNQTVVDLGAGDGIVIFAAASQSLSKKLNTKFIAVEINPFLVFLLNLRKFFHPNKENIKIAWANMFKAKFKIKNSDIKTFYLYISPWYMEKMYKKIKKEVKRFELIGYFYAVPNLKVKKKIKGENDIYVYEF